MSVLCLRHENPAMNTEQGKDGHFFFFRCVLKEVHEFNWSASIGEAVEQKDFISLISSCGKRVMIPYEVWSHCILIFED